MIAARITSHSENQQTKKIFVLPVYMYVCIVCKCFMQYFVQHTFFFQHFSWFFILNTITIIFKSNINIVLKKYILYTYINAFNF